jgi:hypothetical protein
MKLIGKSLFTCPNPTFLQLGFKRLGRLKGFVMIAPTPNALRHNDFRFAA